ncbi:MAG: hypothetical protein EOO73_14965 [Myxococcales bacterium]|nr:MAG: hypothetical protein EOO73_14965 [Myxococcales bacterium]
MSAAVVDRPAWRTSFRGLVAVALGLAAVAFVAGRYVYFNYGGYRPLALAHVPQTMRYRARVDLTDPQRAPALAPLLRSLDPRHVRLPALEKKLGVSASAVVKELAFGAGPDPFDFVLVFGLQRQAGTGLPPAQAVCAVLAEDGIPSAPRVGSDGCSWGDGGIVASTPEGAVVIASRAELVKDVLGTPDIGDRLGFSGPSVRGVAPEPAELSREAATLAQRISAKYP